MKKKIISCAMACTMVVPATMALAGCGKGGDDPEQHTITLEVTGQNNCVSFVNSQNLTGTPGENEKTTFVAKVEKGKDYTFAFKYAPGFDHEGTVVEVNNEELEKTRVYYNDGNQTEATGNIDFTVDRIIEYKVSNVQADTTVSVDLDSYSVRYRVLTLDPSIVQGAKYMLSKYGFENGYDLSDTSNFSQIYDVPADGEIVIDEEEVYYGDGGCVLFLNEDIDAIDLVRKQLVAPEDVQQPNTLKSKTLYCEYTNVGNKILYQGKTAFMLSSSDYHSTVYAKQKLVDDYKDELKYNTGGYDRKNNENVPQVAHQDLFTLYTQVSIDIGTAHNLPFGVDFYSNLNETVNIFEDEAITEDDVRYENADGSVKLVMPSSKYYKDYHFKSANAYVGNVAIDADDSFVKQNAEDGVYADKEQNNNPKSKKYANMIGKNIYMKLNIDNNTFHNYEDDGFVDYDVDDFNYFIVGPDGTKTPITRIESLYYNGTQTEYKFAVITPEDYVKYLTTESGRVGNTYKQYKTGYAFFTYEPKQETLARLIKVDVDCSDIQEVGLDNVHFSLGQYNASGEVESTPNKYLTKFSTFDPVSGKLTYYMDRGELNYINKPLTASQEDIRLSVRLPIAYNNDYEINGINKVCESITVTLTDQAGNVLINNKTYQHPNSENIADSILIDDFAVTNDITELKFDIDVTYKDFKEEVGGSKQYFLKGEENLIDEYSPILITKEYSTDLSTWTKYTSNNLGNVKVGDTVYIASSKAVLSLVQIEYYLNNKQNYEIYHGVDCERLCDNITGDVIELYDEAGDYYYIFKVTVPENNFNHTLDSNLYLMNNTMENILD